MIELNRLYNADYLDGIKDIDDKSIDLIVTDPPYLFDNGTTTDNRISTNHYHC